MSTHRNSQGMVHPLMIALVVVVIAVVGFAGWKVTSNNKNKNSSASTSGTAATTNSAAVASACNKAISDSNICNFASHYNPNAAYKATDTNTASDGTGGTLTISSDGKGNYEMSGTSNGSSFDAITLSGSTYLKDASSGTWIKYSSSSTPSTTSNPASGLKISASDITGNGTISYKNLGTAACGSDTCFKYQIVDTA